MHIKKSRLEQKRRRVIRRFRKTGPPLHMNTRRRQSVGLLIAQQIINQKTQILSSVPNRKTKGRMMIVPSENNRRIVDAVRNRQPRMQNLAPRRLLDLPHDIRDKLSNAFQIRSRHGGKDLYMRTSFSNDGPAQGNVSSLLLPRSVCSTD